MSAPRVPLAPADVAARKAAIRRAFVERVLERAVRAVLAEVEPELARALRAAEAELPAGCGRHRGGKAIQHDSRGFEHRSSRRGRFNAGRRGRIGRVS